MIKRAVVFAVILVVLMLFDIFLFPTIIKNSAIIAPAGSDYQVSPGNFQAIPFEVSNVSEITGAFSSSNQAVEAFVLNSTQFQNMQDANYYLGNFEFASGNVFSGTINATVPPGRHFLVFNNYGIEAQASVIITDSVIIKPFTNSSFLQALLAPGTSFALDPGQYLSIGINLTGPVVLRGSYVLAVSSANSQNYAPFETQEYIMTPSQLADFIANKSTTAPEEFAGTFPNGIYSQLKSGEHYFVVADRDPYSGINVNFSSLDVLGPSPAAVKLTSTIARAEYPVNFTETGNLFAGYSIGISLDGAVQSFVGYVTFLEPNGTYDWYLSSVANAKAEYVGNQSAVAGGFKVTPASGSISVDGTLVTVTVNFEEVRYSIKFVETGLPTGYTWTVSMNTTTLSSTIITNISSISNGMTFYEPNYTGYTFTVIPPQGFKAVPSEGRISVAGINLTETIAFSPES